MTTLITIPDSTGTVAQVNENFKSVSAAGLYGYNGFTTTGLNFGYYGGRAFGNTVANGTVALTGSTTNYIVANRSTGAVTSATDTTDWDDTTDFLKLYSVVTNPSSIFSMVDERQAYGAAGGGGGGSTDWADLTGIPAPIEDLAALTDPGADRLLMWDDSASEYTHATLGTNLSFTGTTLNAAGGGGGGGTIGKHMVPIMAGAMRPSVTGGCAALAGIASASGQPDIVTLDFDPTTIEYAQFAIPMPSSWNEGTVTFRAIWSHVAATGNVIWEMQAVAVSDDDTILANFGTEQSVLDGGGTANDIYISDESAAITIAGSPAAGDLVFFRFYRNASAVGDTLTVDARLHAIQLFMTTDAEVDS